MEQELPQHRSHCTHPKAADSASPIALRRTISPSRSRLQSRLLTFVLGLLLALLTLLTLASRQLGSAGALLPIALAVSLLFALIVLFARAATRPGALAGASVCLLLTIWASAPDRPSHNLLAALLHTGLAPLIALFLCTFAATRAGRARKQHLHLAEDRGGRSASQILANLAVAAITAAALGLVSGQPGRVANVICLAALVEATADTVSSEIGQAFGGEPRLILTLRRVAPGTDGAITLIGTIGGVASAFFVAIVGAWALHLGIRAATAALLGGLAGLSSTAFSALLSSDAAG